MTTASDRLEVLHRTPNELEAAMLARVLEDHGIKATTTGGYTSGFRAEAPGNVSLLVVQADAPRARELLAQIPHDGGVDWNAIDFDDSSSSEERPFLEGEEAEAKNTAPRFQYSLGLLVILQTAICAGLALWRILLGGGQWVLLLLLLGALSLSISATVLIASDLDRARHLWRPIGRLLTVAIAALLLLRLLWAAWEVVIR
jgi:hypothetical protein